MGILAFLVEGKGEDSLQPSGFQFVLTEIKGKHIFGRYWFNFDNNLMMVFVGYQSRETTLSTMSKHGGTRVRMTWYQIPVAFTLWLCDLR